MNDYTPQHPGTPAAFYPPQPPGPQPQKPKWSTRKKVGVGAAVVLGLGVIGGAIGGGTAGNDDDKPAPVVSAQVEDHADYEVEQQRKTAPTTPPPERTYGANPGIPAHKIDDLFVGLLNDEGINASDKTLIEAGRDGVCVLAGGVDDFGDLVLIVMGTTGFDAGDTGTLIGASFAAYCPEHEHLLGEQGRGI